jgi:hypothetical protein
LKTDSSASTQIKRELSTTSINSVSNKKKICSAESVKRQDRRKNEDDETKQRRLNKQRETNKLNILKETIGERQERLEKCNASKQVLKQSAEEKEIMQMNQSKILINNVQTNNLHDISELFKNAIKDVKFYVCYCCTRNCFIEGIAKGKNSDIKNIYESFISNSKKNLSFYENYIEENYYFCHTCFGFLKRNKLPSISILNELYPGDIPNEISTLTDIELGLISQLRPYMKIISLSGSSFGQKGIKGNVIHFAQCVEEVVEQLPLRAKDSGCIIVSELLIGPKRLKEFMVRSNKVYEALKWLKENNILYKNVIILTREENELNVPVIISKKPNNDIKEPNDRLKNCYTDLMKGNYILHGDFHQGSTVLLGSFAGRQCSALCVAAVCVSYIKNIENWDSETLNYILFNGTRIFKNIIDKKGDNNLYLTTDECLTEEYDLYGHKMKIINNLKDDEIFIYNLAVSENNLFKGIKHFCSSNDTLATLTLNNYTFGLIKRQNNIFLFNSHSCSETGRLSEKGKSCVLKYKSFEKEEIIKLMCITILKFVGFKFETDEGNYTFSITPLSVECLTMNLYDISSSHLTSCEENAGNIDFELSTEISAVDMDAPNVENALTIVNNEKKYNLIRETSVPVNANREISVEELSFIKIFPYGKFGFKYPRHENKSKLTYSNYIRSRIMSSDNRYQNNQYLFYLMQMYEIAKVTSSINFCSSKLKKGNLHNRNLHVCLQNLRGYASFWNSICTDLLSLIRCLGPPTWFITLSARDLEWEDLLQVLVNEKRKLVSNFTLDKNSDYKDRANILSEFPVIAARYFNRRFLILLKLLLKTDHILGGKIIDYWYRVEFQSRGSPHIHMLTWIANCPLFNTEEGIKLIESIIKVQKNSGDSELNELVNRLQPHNCKQTCKKSGKNDCRFDFPKKVCNETRILSEEEILNGNGKFCELKRTIDEININNYNPDILKIWTANMDIQPIGSMYGIAYYVAKYCCKPESAHIRKCVNDALEGLRTCPDYEISMRMQNVSNIIMANRERSAQEAAYITCGLKLQGSSRTTIFVNTRPKTERTRMVKKECINNEVLDENSFCSDIYDKYCNRPDELNDICLYEFVTEYSINYVKKQEDEDPLGDEMDVEDETSQNVDQNKYFIKGSSNIIVSKRKKLAALKSPYINIVEEEDEYYYSLMLLYLPFRNENDILEGSTTVKDAYEKNVKLLRPSNNNGLHNNIDELNKALERIEVFRNLSQTNQSTLSDVSEFLNVENVDNNDMIIEEEKDFVPVEEKSLKERINLLNTEQCEIYEKLKLIIRSGTELVRMMIHGYGGTGKSFLAKVIIDTINLHKGNKIENVVICAPTGVAAKNIGGLTCHSVFRLPIQKFTVGEFSNLSGKILQNMREKWKNINWVIIDEISMVAYSQFRQIHLRLQQFKESELPFGGVNIILMGDLLQLKPFKNQPRVFEFIPQYLCEIDLWKLFEFHDLKINQRQKDDKSYGELCCRIRDISQNSDDINILNSRLLNNLLNPDYFSDAVRLYCRKDDVKMYNDLKFQELQNDNTNNKVYNLVADDTYGEGLQMNQPIDKNDLYSEEEKCGGIPNFINVKIGCRVMLRRNLDVSQGLVNGSMGIITGFQWDMLRREPMRHGELPLCVLVKFDDENIS